MLASNTLHNMLCCVLSIWLAAGASWLDINCGCPIHGENRVGLQRSASTHSVSAWGRAEALCVLRLSLSCHTLDVNHTL